MTERKEEQADRFVVEGGQPLSGTVTPAGNKNEALPVLAAAVLARGETTVQNVPRIRDVTLLLDGLRRLGVRVDTGDGEDPQAAAWPSSRNAERELHRDHSRGRYGHHLR